MRSSKRYSLGAIFDTVWLAVCLAAVWGSVVAVMVGAILWGIME